MFVQLKSTVQTFYLYKDQVYKLRNFCFARVQVYQTCTDQLYKLFFFADSTVQTFFQIFFDLYRCVEAPGAFVS